ncbi:MAG: ABC transporter ATP-binding protein [Gammaproteobacteria bacterium RIFCSPHIGHO2_12_FULL_40_19]|nr:MAG: ABC transporter ATP-binding protein [Gammaproteobacteria bacterium RIFCSPHIGHO2_12_FULL_40_19]
MQILNLKDLSAGFGVKPLFQNINLQVNIGECIALVGRNGVGKSSLLKIIAGEYSPDSGSVQFSKNTTISMLSQTVPLKLTGSVYDVIATGLSEIGALLQSYQVVLKKLETDVSEKLLAEQATLAQKIDACDGWSFDQKIQTVLSKLDLKGHDEITALSGGLKRRVLLARALVNDPDILLLDEPTNHLDIDAVLWLESFLKKYTKTIILITHDRNFMSNLATRIIEIDYQNLFSWPGNYAHYCQLKEELIVAQEREQALFDKRLSDEEVWIRQGVKARRTRNEGRVRRLEALRKEKSEQFKQQGKSKIHIQSDTQSGKVVFNIEDLSFAYADKNNKKIIRHFSSIIGRGDCVGIVGQNGAGKSTLIKLLLGDLSPTSGTITRGTNLEIAYFDQYRLELDETQTVQDNVGLGREKITINGKEKHVISYLQDFLFSPERARIKVSGLSGGEKNRLLLAKLFSRPSNLIVMDEPTNDLDIETLELLEEKLSDFPGTLLIVSHDRAFLNNVVTQLWVMGSDGHIQEHVGGHFDWENLMPQKSTPFSDEKKEKVDVVKIKTQKITRPERRELNALPKKITALENEIVQLQHVMLDSGFYQQSKEQISAHNQKLSAAESALAKCYERWQKLEDKI